MPGIYVNPEDFGKGPQGDYRWDRPLPSGTYEARVAVCEPHRSPKGNDSVKLTLDVDHPAGGVRVDYYVNFEGWRWRELVTCLAPALLEAGGEFDCDAQVGRRVKIRTGQQEDIKTGADRPAVQNLLEALDSAPPAKQMFA